MRTVVLGVFLAGCVWAQPFVFGVKGGVPMTDFLNNVGTPGSVFSSVTATNRYIIGPTAELRLPFGLGVEFDALYRHFGAVGNTPGLVSTVSSGAWEFPLLAKYRFPFPIVRPYVDAGVAWDKLSGISQTGVATIAGIVPSAPVQPQFAVHSDTVAGFVLGGGVEIHALIVHISPEIRYTRWNAQHFTSATSLVESNQNQVEFLVGLTF
jgi:opacity protein-like surface antigen